MAQEDNRSNVPTFLVPQPVCAQFRRWGSCGYGDKCRYIHTTGPSQGIGVEQRNLRRVELCHFFASGRGCPYGNECNFLHERNQNLVGGKGLYRESSAITIVTSGREVRNKTRSDILESRRPVDLPKKLPKTKLCNFWERTGSCPYGSTCQFAHGKAELQSLGSSNPPESLRSAGISAPAKNVASSAPSEHKFEFKWTDVHKIGRIYADWID
ncbi:hypothetical protein HAX54_027149 [Datura stramonium]|uniref:C3H1-type domain-containing protein n=1 Tax=Datura stramonium TaxID=4076 RepID=A0ABS8RKG5_DATST|nr:hypothetical protein [Datura stramonium]